ncbi:MAG: S41 family peptidase [Chloroflexota bacterium]|jgi:carboxyl-terminal processing protease
MNRWPQWILFILALLIILGSSFTAGVVVERNGALPGSILREEPQGLAEQFTIFWEAWNIVERHFVDRSAVDAKEMTYGAIEGMLGALGDAGHTRFMTPEEAAFQSSDISGQFYGIGAELGEKDGYPIIVAPMDDSPAQKAGIKAGDILVEVEGQTVAGLSLDRVVRMVRGPEGTPVTLKVIHPGENSLTEITIIRGKITVHPVSWAMLPGTDIAHLRLSQFNANAGREIVAAIKELKAAGARALVLDVRSNSGGLLDQCIEVTSQFIPSGDVLIERNAEGNQKVHSVTSGGQATDMPLVVLVNRGTASAAEILAGAVQDNNRGQVVGETTFGTGTVLSSFRLSDGSAILLGTSEWLTPSGRQIWKKGIEPDITVTLSPDAEVVIPRMELEMTPEQLRAITDAQLLKAIELLEKGS